MNKINTKSIIIMEVLIRPPIPHTKFFEPPQYVHRVPIQSRLKVGRLIIPDEIKSLLDDHLNMLGENVRNRLAYHKIKHDRSDLDCVDERDHDCYSSLHDLEFTSKIYFSEEDDVIEPIISVTWIIDTDGYVIRRPIYKVGEFFRLHISIDRFFTRQRQLEIDLLYALIHVTTDPLNNSYDRSLCRVISPEHEKAILDQYPGAEIKEVIVNQYVDGIIKCMTGNTVETQAQIQRSSKTSINRDKSVSYKSHSIEIDLPNDGQPIVKKSNIPKAHKTKYLAYGYKKCYFNGEHCLVKLGIPDEKRIRINKAINSGGKVRTNKAHVLAIVTLKRGEFPNSTRVKFVSGEANSIYDPSFVYKIGSQVKPDSYDDSKTECTMGLHFFFDPIEALMYLNPDLEPMILIDNLDQLIDADYINHFEQYQGFEKITVDENVELETYLFNKPDKYHSIDDGFVTDNEARRRAEDDPFYSQYVSVRPKSGLRQRKGTRVVDALLLD